mmetsp:Transcript_568/g.1751  ORF Transcript_568/g.1751 Transcript_568/m.1751 type:complete len:294 (-) Transcript_568:1200-2081(-)
MCRPCVGTMRPGCPVLWLRYAVMMAVHHSGRSAARRRRRRRAFSGVSSSFSRASRRARRGVLVLRGVSVSLDSPALLESAIRSSTRLDKRRMRERDVGAAFFFTSASSPSWRGGGGAAPASASVKILEERRDAGLHEAACVASRSAKRGISDGGAGRGNVVVKKGWLTRRPAAQRSAGSYTKRQSASSSTTPEFTASGHFLATASTSVLRRSWSIDASGVGGLNDDVSHRWPQMNDERKSWSLSLCPGRRTLRKRSSPKTQAAPQMSTPASYPRLLLMRSSGARNQSAVMPVV